MTRLLTSLALGLLTLAAASPALAGGIDTDYRLRPAEVIGLQGSTVEVPVFFDNDSGGVQGFDFSVCSLASEVTPLGAVPGGRLETLVVDFFQATVDAGGVHITVVLDAMSWIPLGDGHEIARVEYQLNGTAGTLLGGGCGGAPPQITAFSAPVTPLFELGAIHISPFDATNHHVIFAGEDFSGAINSVDAIRTALEAAGQSTIVVNELSSDLIINPKAIWVCCGTYPYNHQLSPVDGAFLALSVQFGVPVYVEGNDVWGFDPQTSFADYDGVLGSAVEDGDDSFTSMTGFNYGPAQFLNYDADYNQDNAAGSDYTDRLVASSTDSAGPNAGIVWRNDDALIPYGTGVMYDTNGSFGNVLVQSWEFGGYDLSQSVLMLRYLEALELSASGQAFGRGDINSDGDINIADALNLLGTLFSGAPAPGCADAADTNDDGALNVADVVQLLNFLFGGGAPLPAPGCGVDPTADPLGCDTGTPCLI